MKSILLFLLLFQGCSRPPNGGSSTAAHLDRDKRSHRTYGTYHEGQVVDPFDLHREPPVVPPSTITVTLGVPPSFGLTYAAWVVATAEDPESTGLWASIRFALPSYGVRCVHSILRSTLEGPISREIVQGWATETLSRESGARSYGLWCSYTKCVLLVEACDPSVKVEAPDAPPGEVRGRVDPSGRYGVAYDREDGSFGTFPLPVGPDGTFSFLIPPCRESMSFMDVDLYEDQGTKIRPLLTVRLACGRPRHPRIVDPLRIGRIEDPRRAERALFSMVNHFRRLKGLHPLSWDSRLAMAARHHSEALCKLGDLYHKRPDGSTPESRARAAGYPGKAIGENLALAIRVQVLALAWYESYSHRQLLQDPAFTDAGVGLCDTFQDGYVYRYATLLAGQR